MSFYDEIIKLDLDKFKDLVETRSDADVERTLAKSGPLGIEDFAALISPAAQKHYLKEMVMRSMQLTVERYGGTLTTLAEGGRFHVNAIVPL